MTEAFFVSLGYSNHDVQRIELEKIHVLGRFRAEGVASSVFSSLLLWRM